MSDKEFREAAEIEASTPITVGGGKLAEDLDYEKAARVYYQDIVYKVCNILDELDQRKVSFGEGLVCGCVSSPSTEVQDRVKQLAWKIKQLESRKETK